MNPLSFLEKAINEHGSSSILKERLQLVKDQLAKVSAERDQLQTQLAEAIAEIVCLKEAAPDKRFVEYYGVRFRIQ
ncbi:hypothetical protein [Cerasicoccus frondis]|uniref:hypothetical protein n=1 Tax=Cerasicoccus frondis TaxID=490090 RepID=UPI002852577B|nr:hypothetical protein [Cerasicoccus frondis]